ncbi:hypothetical protein HK101_004305 [Irineochytrium annulatum]|nr:hypothetical protein HK101_004305 [Irineochytrium annulatum]
MDSAVVADKADVGRIAEVVGLRLSRREDKPTLVGRNILKDDETLSPRILQSKIQLEKEKQQDHLNRRMVCRPTKEDLNNRNIMIDSENPDEHTLQKTAEFQRSISSLNMNLKQRPEKTALEQMNIIKPGDNNPILAEATEKLRRAQLEDTLANKLKNRPDIDDLVTKQIIAGEGSQK